MCNQLTCSESICRCIRVLRVSTHLLCRKHSLHNQRQTTDRWGDRPSSNERPTSIDNRNNITLIIAMLNKL